jgi:hypothetical protein
MTVGDGHLPGDPDDEPAYVTPEELEEEQAENPVPDPERPVPVEPVTDDE